MQSRSYKAIPIENVEFSIDELKRMGIVYLDNLGQLKNALSHLGVKNVDQANELFDYGYILSQIGSLCDPTWVLYSKNHSLEYVLDIRDRKNFYNLLLENGENSEVVFHKIHIREEHVEKDLTHYIELDLKARSSLYPVFSEFLQ